MTNDIILTKKQAIAWKFLLDDVTTEILYGGGAGGGKSFLGCLWLTLFSLHYSGTRWLMGRAVLKNLKDSTLLTLFDFFKQSGLTAGVHYNYNAQSNVIRFCNNSEIYLKDLFQYPSDPEFDSLGSTEYTGAFIDEASQINEKAKNIVLSRLRYKIQEFNLTPKLLICSNPFKNFLYYDFYKPSKEGKLPNFRAFIPSTVDDNRFLPESYKSNLLKLDKQTKERLLYGNWDYVDDPSILIEADKIFDLFTNPDNSNGKMFISCDIARFGGDNTVIFIWDNLTVIASYEYSKKSTKEIRLILESFAKEYKVPRSNIVVDEDGVGGGVKDELIGIKGFVNNSTPILNKNYSNLKSECYFMLADYITKGKICIKDMPVSMKEKLIADLEQVKKKDIDKEGKLSVLGKDRVKEFLGRSPDYSDALMMRMYYELRYFPEPSIAGARIYN
jgi:phage terminase large subunit